MRNNKSNRKEPFRGRRFRGRGSAGQAALDYILAIIIIAAPLILTLNALLEALDEPLKKLGVLLAGWPYP